MTESCRRFCACVACWARTRRRQSWTRWTRSSASWWAETEDRQWPPNLKWDFGTDDLTAIRLSIDYQRPCQRELQSCRTQWNATQAWSSSRRWWKQLPSYLHGQAQQLCTFSFFLQLTARLDHEREVSGYGGLDAQGQGHDWEGHCAPSFWRHAWRKNITGKVKSRHPLPNSWIILMQYAKAVLQLIFLKKKPHDFLEAFFQKKAFGKLIFFLKKSPSQPFLSSFLLSINYLSLW